MPSTTSAAPDHDRELIRDRIVATATDLFIRQGYNGVSFLAIARVLGISHSHIHYYYRTKAVLAEAVLGQYIEGAKADFRRIWASEDANLLSCFVQSRDWMFHRYLAYNPGGSGGHNWGLLSRFATEAEAMSPAVRRMLRSTLDEMDSLIADGVSRAVARGELSQDAPKAALVLQISSLLHTSRNLTRLEGSFERLDDLLHWTLAVIRKAYGRDPAPLRWPPIGATAPSRRRRKA